MRVERHFEHRRDAAGRRAARSGFPAFPVGPPWLIEMNVRVYNAWKYNEPGSIDDFFAIANFTTDGADRAVRDADVGDCLPRGKDGGAAPDHDVRSGHTSSIVMSCAPSQRVSRPISGSCS